MKTKKILRCAAIVVIIIGAVLAVTVKVMESGAKKEFEKAVAKRTETVDGTVISCVKKKRSTHSSTHYGSTHGGGDSFKDNYTVTIRYVIDGIEYTLVDYSNTDYPVNCITPVNYDPADPHSAHTGGAQFDNRTYKAFFMGGTMAAIVGLVLLLNTLGIIGRRRYR